jgi:prephenate dehydrogenase
VRIGVVGLGLIGGSIARDLTRLDHTVSGGDVDERAVDAALKEGVLRHRLGMDGDGVDACDVVILALPVQHVAGWLRMLVPRVRDCRLLMDTGSTKADITKAALEAGLAERFVGAHPLAGDHLSGWGASRTGLFQGARVFLCPAQGAQRDALQLAETIWRSIGAETVHMDAKTHDEQLAWTSHLPQLTATALALTLAGAHRTRREMGTGGLDMTRLAGSDPEMWTGIALHNRDPLQRALASMQQELDALRAALDRGDSVMLRARFEAAREWHRRAGD